MLTKARQRPAHALQGSVALVAQWYDVDADARFMPGQTIVVMQPVSGKAARTVRRIADPTLRLDPVMVFALGAVGFVGTLALLLV